MNEKITTENVFDVDVPALALDSRFGSLVFENANKKLGKAQSFLKEVYDLRHRELLNDNDIKQVGNLTNKLVEHLEWLRNFDISTVTNAKQEHDNFESRIDGLYNDIYGQVLMRILPFLREERRRENPDEKQLDEEVKKAVQIRTELETGLKEIREETEKIRTTNKEVGSAKGQRATVQMATHFDTETNTYRSSAKKWRALMWAAYFLIVALIIGFGYWYWLGKASFAWQSGIAKLVLISALWYGLSLIIKNYNVNSHLAAVNRHRAAVARTLDDFLASNPERQNEMLRNATEAMFKHAPIGFVSKTEKESGNNPVLQIVNDIVNAGRKE